MKRRLFTILATLSLLLFVAVVVIWVRSVDYLDSYQRIGFYAASYQGRCHIIRESESGLLFREHVGLSSIWMTEPNITRCMVEPWEEAWAWGANRRSFAGVRLSRREFPGVCTMVLLTVPHWVPSVATALLPVAVVAQCCRRHYRTGLCPSCGYDLRATPGRCPECGEVPAKAGK